MNESKEVQIVTLATPCPICGGTNYQCADCIDAALFPENVPQPPYKLAVETYGLRLAHLLNEFLHKTRPDDWDGPEPIRATRAHGEIILEEWAIEALSVK